MPEITGLPNTLLPPTTDTKPPSQTRLSVSVEPAGSETITIGPDELEADRTLTSITYQTELPGGFGPGDFTVPMPPGSSAPKTWLLGGVRVYDADSDQTYYEGRITNVSSDTESATVTIQTEGWAKHLSDDTTAREIFIDRDLSKWGEPSLQEKIILITSNYSFTAATSSGFQDSSNNSPGLLFDFHNVQKNEGTSPGNLMSYYGDGVDIGQVFFDQTGDATTSWEKYLIIAKDDVRSSQDLSTNYSGSASNENQSLKATVSGRKYAMFYVFYTGTFIGQLGNTQRFTSIAVLGRHGLTTRGVWPGIGLFVSDMAPYAIARWAPLLTYTTGPEGSIEATTFAVPHSVFTEEGTVTAMLEAWSLFGGQVDEPLQWGVYEGKRVFLRQASGFGRVWRVRQDQTAKSQDQGADASERINGVRVTYDRGDGQPRSVGPVGSQSTIETNELVDPNPSNPANADGARHWVTYNAGVMNDEQAKLVGGLILARSTEERWRGSITIEGWGYDESGVPVPSALARAGDWVVVEDDPAGDTAPRQVRNTSFDGAGKVANCAVGAPPDELSVLLARAGVVLQGKT